MTQGEGVSRDGAGGRERRHAVDSMAEGSVER
jgi:hypothetical protein